MQHDEDDPGRRIGLDRTVLAHARLERIRFIGVFDTVGSLGTPRHREGLRPQVPVPQHRPERDTSTSPGTRSPSTRTVLSSSRRSGPPSRSRFRVTTPRSSKAVFVGAHSMSAAVGSEPGSVPRCRRWLARIADEARTGWSARRGLGHPAHR
ncbi:DUF2235 domain-containing protein [Pseudonocardia sp. MCCB 268]|nr:DUF2235 domain-containing protein [Pseudonocardia cytotoxica]